MTNVRASGPRQFMRLRDSFRTAFPWNHHDLTRDGFRQWARKKRQPPINVDAHHWKPLREGEAVPREMVEAFSEYAALMLLVPAGECRLSVIAETCDPPEKKKTASGGRPRVAYASGWKYLYSFWADSFAIDESARCNDESDLLVAARYVFECVGWHDKRLSGNSAIAYAEGVMKRTLEEYAQALLLFWQTNEHAVLFATQKRGGTVERIGVSVCVAVTEDFYRRFRAGEAMESQIEPGDLVPQSQFVLIQAYAENVAIDLKQNKVARSLAQSRNALYQLASLFLPVQYDAWQPHMVTFAGSTENGKRQHAYGFSPTGAKLAETGKIIVEFAPPTPDKQGVGYVKALAEYLPMKSLIQIFQAYIESQRPLLE
ncbi:hypothetical protein [Singulisphaera acidiphila]|uniref:Uncharacterized protein n=1 Tax=Singulisphaera acidiphila (strain ATCC BAA-1392 / DSM 18658 / VKM B-2454 / MOB10) TaxID=886293 RepID=L0DQG9_SINAD|nr:hypothetical protein [Singulisphaera acidiphila]AGA31689.1 hypothetical protein Sinac_7660 [Singulisphaera acidiphila DSM 18658]